MLTVTVSSPVSLFSISEPDFENNNNKYNIRQQSQGIVNIPATKTLTLCKQFGF